MAKISREFLDSLLATVPEDKRAAVEEGLADEGTHQFLADGALRQADYSRGMDTLKDEREALAVKATELEGMRGSVNAKYQEQTAWWEANQPLIEAGKRAMAVANGDDPAKATKPAAADPPEGMVRKEEVEQMLTEREGGAAEFFVVLNDLSMRHFQEFGERLDAGALLHDPKIKEVGIEALYRDTFKDRYAEKAKKAEDDRIEKRVEDRLAEERKTVASRPLYPVAPGDGSPLDALTTKDPDPSQFSAEAAADEYLGAVAKRTTG